jgi:hypothetical protein
MIELPDWASPNDATPALFPPNEPIRPVSGGAGLLRLMPGQRFRVALSFPPMRDAEARILVSRLIRAQSEGLRVRYPLAGEEQRVAGQPVVNGVPTGKTLALRNLAPSTPILEGYWFSINESGQHWLHNVAVGGIANSLGQATISVEPMIRGDIGDGATVHFARPFLEGFVISEPSWNVNVDRLVSIGVTVEEAE